MKKPIMEIYALAVCFVCVAFSAIFITVAVYSGIEVAYPKFTLSAREYQTYQSDANFLENKLRFLPANRTSVYENMTPQELTAARNSGFQSALDSERRSGWQGVLRSLIAIVILAPIFALHWKLARRTRRNNPVVKNGPTRDSGA